MSAIQGIYKKIENQIKKLLQKKYFDEVYVFGIACIALLGWKFNGLVGMGVIILTATIMIFITKDLKYIIPNVIYIIYCISSGFSNEHAPIPILILAGIFVIVLLIFTIRQGIRLSKMHSLLGFVGLAIANVLPILWTRSIPKAYSVFYFLFFANAAYLLIYVFFVNGIKKNSFKMLALTMSYLAILLAFECALKVYELKDTKDSIFELWYYMGWGLCNEAGLMICFSLPFTFYLLAHKVSIRGMIFDNLKILVSMAGLILSNCRGAYLFGFLEVGFLYLALLFCSKKPRTYQNLFFGYAILILIGIVIFKDISIQIFEKAYDAVFKEGLDDNGRFDLWRIAYGQWNQTPLTRMLGPGICTYFDMRETAAGIQYTPVIFHSTFFETLAVGGVFGIACLSYHLYQKYKALARCEFLFALTAGTAYLGVGIYGMIDNTYHMYYYMMALAVGMAAIDASRKEKENILF